MFGVNSTPHMNPRCFWKWLFYPPNWQHLLSPFGKRAWQFYKKWSWLLSMSKLVAENVPPTHTDGSPITLCIINYLDSIILIKFLCSILMTVERDHRGIIFASLYTIIKKQNGWYLFIGAKSMPCHWSKKVLFWPYLSF